MLDEWNRLNRVVMRDDVLRALPLAELYSRACLHFQHNHFNLMLLVALVQAAAMDVVLSECGMPRLLPCLRRECNEYKGRMLVFLVGYVWQTIRAHDASTINTHLLVHKWMEASCT